MTIKANDEQAPTFTFHPATLADLETLVALRIAALRESLERVGRFTPERARARFIESFRPQHTRLIRVGRALAGCVAFGPRGDDWEIEHFYLDPAFQGVGLGAAVMTVLLAEADAAGMAVALTVLEMSDANRFYARFGFAETGREGVDIYRRRPAPA
ncbi:GNAT family N-acetyltransferase [Phenylobacterium sp.]|uniref:GNAT family N-acetyltransferase n=1 Tax=Phenylobacterium sp. TaxID=1871053 RepID=UPI00286E8DC5|nr:GNAT family N-acetyltransferase [Phenylobacterium sp.]